MRLGLRSKIFCLASLSLVCVFLGLDTFAYSPEACIQCHRQGARESSLHISIKDFRNSAHGKVLECEDCHTNIIDASHITLIGSSAVSCRECHEQENRHGVSSGREPRPKCYTCHTRHHILGKEDPASSVYPEALKKTCAGCHPSECGHQDYLSWFLSLQVVSHGKADLSKSYGRDNCVGCHQGSAAHGEKGSIDSQDCFKCHQSMWGLIHPKANPEKDPALFAAALSYQAFALLLLWGGVRYFMQRSARNRRVRK
jgi:hypothetical protein